MESVNTAPPETSITEIKPAEPQQKADCDKNSNSTTASTSGCTSSSERVDAAMLIPYCNSATASTAGCSSSSERANPAMLISYGPTIYSAILGSPARLSEYQGMQLEITDQERTQRIEDLIDEMDSCRCPTDTFDLGREGNPYIETIIRKLRKMPRCMQYRAYRDILVYVKYLRRKHRKMLLRTAGPNILTC